MRQPYGDLLSEVEPRIEELGFHATRDEEFGREYQSRDFCLVFDLDRSGSSMNASIYHKPKKRLSSLAIVALIPSIDPLAYERMKSLYKLQTKDAEREALNEYVSFLEKYQDIVFQYPFPEPYRSKLIARASELLGETAPDAKSYNI